MQQRRWFNPTQPQTLQIAVMLLYLNAAFSVIGLLIPTIFPVWWFLVMIAGQAAGAYGIANERKWGYAVGITMAVLPMAARFLLWGSPFEGTNIINLMFEVALIALLVHPQSRDYQRIWFK